MNMMKRILTIFMLIGVLLGMKAATPIGVFSQQSCLAHADTAYVQKQKDESKVVQRKMSHSAYPVRMQVVGNAIRLDSPESQILPIYTQNGTFYLIVRLNKGTNWLNGLPKGKYFINNRLLAIK